MELTIHSDAAELAASPHAAALEDVAELIRMYRPRVLRFVLLSIGDPDVAESITQDAFLKAYQTRDRFRGECTVPTWLTRIAYHLLCDHTRLEKYKFWKKVSKTSVDAADLAGVLPGGGCSAEATMIVRERLQAVLTAVAALPLQQRSVFTLHFMEELSVGEISEILSMRRATVKTHLYRATAKLRGMNGGRR